MPVRMTLKEWREMVTEMTSLLPTPERKQNKTKHEKKHQHKMKRRSKRTNKQINK